MRQAHRNVYVDPDDNDHFLLKVFAAALWIAVFIGATATQGVPPT